MQAEDPFGEKRPQLLGLAYRMLGSSTEAEDVLQDAWLRFNAVSDVGNRDGLLTTIVTRLCLDRLKSAQARREVYVGTWLPEPVADSEALAPDAVTELADDLSFALLLALERLSPAERAAFLLHDVFDMPFAEIAAVLGRQEAACRKLASRARHAVRRERPVPPSPAEAHQRLLEAFGKAVASGNLADFASLLQKDAVLLSDGGGKALAALNPITGAERIARFFIGVARKFAPQQPDLRVDVADINGAPGIVIRSDDRVDQTLTIATDGIQITAIYLVRNPEKLGDFRLK